MGNDTDDSFFVCAAYMYVCILYYGVYDINKGINN
jgi:hypothetical protein